MKKRNTAVYIGFSGCKVNQFEKNLLAEKFISLGFSVTNTVKTADVIVYNTCCVTKKAETGCRQALNRYHSENPSAKIVVTGCLAEKDRGVLQSIPYVSMVVGNQDKNIIPELLTNASFKKVSTLNFEFKQSFRDRSRAILKVQDGCDSYCSYCIVPFVRGNPVSMRKEDVIKNLRNLKNEREVILTGIHLGKWGREFGENLTELIKAVKTEGFPFRIRVSSLDPTEISDELLIVLKDMDNFCPHFHISLQSASDKILGLMGRKYRAMDFVDRVKKIRQTFPSAGIGVDVIVGFPGEEEGNFKETENVLKDSPIDYMHIFPYSKREGTKAAEMNGQVTQEDKKDRVKRLKLLDSEKRRSFIERFYNKIVFCLVDKKEGEFYRAITREYLKVYLKQNPGSEEFSAKVIDKEMALAIII
ncbi:MAG: tRNA (N(6)-L-threonylcarbamoyladenosine(37)-C(2))-methylthiotransferase MtaB [bacterium]